MKEVKILHYHNAIKWNWMNAVRSENICTLGLRAAILSTGSPNWPFIPRPTHKHYNFEYVVIVKKQGRIASHRARCKGFQDKLTGISRIVKVLKNHVWAVSRNILWFDQYLGVAITASLFCYRDSDHYRIFTRCMWLTSPFPSQTHKHCNFENVINITI